MKPETWAAPAVLIFALAFAASPLIVPDFGGFDPQAFPIPQDTPPVQPAGYAFAIWGVIFLWLVIGAGYGVVARRATPDWTAMRVPLALSLAVGAVWLPVATISPVWATILIWAMLLPALAALNAAPREAAWAAAWPVGLYAGWLSAASCVAIGLLLGGYGILSEITAAYLMVGVAIALAFAVMWRLARAPTYGVAAIWAFIAVAVQNGFAGVGILALIGAVLLLVPTLRAARG
ncbi:MAG: hypothetical protein AAFY52_03430 [Pseudomonadota bacterium]